MSNKTDTIDNTIPSRFSMRLFLRRCVDKLSTWSPLHRRKQRSEWKQRIQDLQKEIKHTRTYHKESQLHCQIGHIHSQHLQQIEKASVHYQFALNSDQTNTSAVTSLLSIYKQSHQWQKAIDLLQQQTNITTNTSTSTDHYFQIGEILLQHLSERTNAIQHFEKALEYNPHHLPSLNALQTIFTQDKQWDQAIHTLQRSKRIHTCPEKKASLLFEIGNIYIAHQKNFVEADISLQQALQQRPDNVQIANDIAILYIEHEQWNLAKKVLEHLLPLATKKELQDELHRFHFMAGLIDNHLNCPQSAIHHYRMSYCLHPLYFPTIHNFSILLDSLKKWQQAQQIHHILLNRFHDVLTVRESSDLHCRMARSYEYSDYPKQALRYSEQALEIDPINPNALKCRAHFAERRSDWKTSKKIKDLLLLQLTKQSEKANTLSELGYLSHWKLHDPNSAISYLQQASSSDPKHTKSLSLLTKLFQETHQWKRSIQPMESLLLRESDLEKKLSLHIRLANIYYKYSTNNQKALQHYSLALDLDGDNDIASSGLETIFTAQQSWPRLEQHLQRILRHLDSPDSSHPKKTIDVLKKLGSLYRNQLKNTEQAIHTYERILHLQPSFKHLTLLADAYEQNKKYYSKALTAHHEILKKDPSCLPSYRSLIRVYGKLNKQDQSFVVCKTLDYLNETSPSEKDFLKKMSTQTMFPTRSFAKQEAWPSKLEHSFIDSPLTHVFKLILEECPQILGKDKTVLKTIKRSHSLDPDLFFSKMVEKVSQVFGNTLPFRQSHQEVDCRLVLADQRSMILVSETMFRERHPKELLFLIAKLFFLAQPEFVLASILSQKQIEELVSSIVKIHDSSSNNTRHSNHFTKALSTQSYKKLCLLAKECSDKPVQKQIDDFLIGITYTANRIGFSFSGEIGALSSIINICPLPKPMPIGEQIKDLVQYSLSNTYFSFRKEQGIGIDSTFNASKNT